MRVPSQKSFVAISIILFSSLLIAAPKDTRNNTTSFGAGMLSDVALDSHTAHGSLIASNASISQLLTVNGALTADNLVVHDVKINGAAQFTDTEITGTLKINGATQIMNSKIKQQIIAKGALLGENSNLQGDIDITTNKLQLNDCHTKNILIRYSTSKKKQLVELSGQTVIDGDITFEAKDGEVYIEPNVKIKGMVYGGTVKSVTSNSIHRESRMKP